MSIEVLDPTYGGGANAFALAGRLDSLAGKTVGIISNGKRGTRPYFSALEKYLKQQVPPRLSGIPNPTTAPLPKHPSWRMCRTGTQPLPESVTEALVRRAVCMTQ